LGGEKKIFLNIWPSRGKTKWFLGGGGGEEALLREKKLHFMRREV